ncbi:transposase [Sorangium sp. So ce269]
MRRLDATIKFAKCRHKNEGIPQDATGKPKTGFVWTFVSADAHGGSEVAYHFAESRSGSTPKALLEGTKGVLLVDGYSGYNDVETNRRLRDCA